MPAGTRFDWHTHTDHQLAWAASGVLTVMTADATWVLPPTRALWIPAGWVASRVGYDTPSAFVAAFRRETGQTPAAYFRSRRDLPLPPQPQPGVPGGERQRVPGQVRRPAHRARPVSHLALGPE